VAGAQIVSKTFTAAIPTHDRERELGACLESIVAQSALPDEVLVIDDARLPAAFLEHWKARFGEKGAVLNYHRKDHQAERRGLSESKNLALKKAAGDVVFFLDDDVILEADFFKEIMAVWNGAEDEKLLGVGGLIRNARMLNRTEKIFRWIFGLTGECSWDVNPAGFTVWDEGIAETTKGYYMHGGGSSYLRREAQKLGFATFSGGRTALEDLDFCLTAKKLGFHFIIVPKAKVVHNHSGNSCEGEFLVGMKDSLNRKDIYRRLGLKTLRGRIWFYWASLGWVARLIPGLRLARAAGMIFGHFKP